MAPSLSLFVAAFVGCAVAAPPSLIWSDEFNFLDFSKWKHEITLGGGGNWEFEFYSNNRSTSFVNNSILSIQPILTADIIGDAAVKGNPATTMDVWGADPASLCTGNAFYGCSRTSGAGGNYLNPIASARMRTAETFNFKYGTVEIRAKLPKGDWMWPAIWMLPENEAYGQWPASGEIDIMESRGNAAGYAAGGVNEFGSTLHWGPFYPEDPFAKTHATYTLPTGDLSEDFHIYGLIWNETNIVTYIDTPDQVVLNVDMTNQSFWERGGWGPNLHNPWVGQGNNAPFDQNFYLILNVAVGGTSDYFPDGAGGKPWTNADPHAVNAFYDASAQWLPTWQAAAATGQNALQVDYVRVYQ